MSLFKNLNFEKLKEGLQKTRNKIVNGINEAVIGNAAIDEKTLEEIEEILISSDIGFEIAEKIIEDARFAFNLEKDRSQTQLIETIKNELTNVLSQSNENGLGKIGIKKPFVILIVGVNGTGKTTTIGKLAHNYKKSGLNVVVGAADTFRAAANEQLDIWAKRAGVKIVQKKHGADPSAVAFETVSQAIKGSYDVALIDTAGRLHNKAHLMEELGKLKRAINKVLPDAPDETFLVVDGTTGQNALVQAEEFSKVTDISGLIVTKLDGTAKGGVIFQIYSKNKIPVRYIGVGEEIDDLQTFDPKLFISAIFDN